MTAVYLLVALFLVLVNAFFVLAEFAAVKMRPTRVDELVQAGDARARLFQAIQSRLDEYLSVCQVGITFTSIGLGFVGEPAIARLVEPALTWMGATSAAAAHGIAITIAYVVVSFVHIVLGELVPKSVAIRAAEGAALAVARPLRFFHALFYVPLVVLNKSANAVLWALGVPPAARDESHSEEELRIILSRSQARGLISFRRLLFIENIFDIGGVKVRHAMRPAAQVKVLRLGAPWAENEKVVRESRFSRYPLVDPSRPRPVGFVHVKDLYYHGGGEPDLAKLARPLVTARPDDDIEVLLAELQRKRAHAAVVTAPDGGWSGFLTLEDVIEEILGTIEDEFEVEPPWSVAAALDATRVVTGLHAASIEEAVRAIVEAVPASSLPRPKDEVMAKLIERERVMSTYLGAGLALPHARLEGIEHPAILLARSEEGVPAGTGDDRARLFFVLLTPSQNPRSQVRLLARIAGMMDSEFVRTRLMEARTAVDLVAAVQDGEAAALS